MLANLRSHYWNENVSVTSVYWHMEFNLYRPLPFADVLVSVAAQLPRGPLLKRGSTITLICNATVTTTGPSQVQVQWLRWPIPALVFRGQGSAAVVSSSEPPDVEKPTQVAALMYDGVADIYVNGSEISIDRVSAISYRLRVHAATLEDQGMYACHAEAWGQDPHGGWYNTGARAESNAVTVYLYARGECALLDLCCRGLGVGVMVQVLLFQLPPSFNLIYPGSNWRIKQGSAPCSICLWSVNITGNSQHLPSTLNGVCTF